ncbi:MAG: hypothetical protein D6753_04180 [Planctomycetota bacterium]|nr:MAG: hypothetical protein D6753_04180 [Planctomycetota bacterium]
MQRSPGNMVGSTFLLIIVHVRGGKRTAHWGYGQTTHGVAAPGEQLDSHAVRLSLTELFE